MSTLSTCRPGNLYNFKIKDHLHNCFLIFKLKYQLAYFYFRRGDYAVAPETMPYNEGIIKNPTIKKPTVFG